MHARNDPKPDQCTTTDTRHSSNPGPIHATYLLFMAPSQRLLRDATMAKQISYVLIASYTEIRFIVAVRTLPMAPIQSPSRPGRGYAPSLGGPTGTLHCWLCWSHTSLVRYTY